MRVFTLWMRGVSVALALVAATASAQETLRGTVTDAVTSRPVVGAIVRLGPSASARATRTDETGGFLFTRLAPGSYELDIRALGYEMDRRTVDVASGTNPPVEVSLNRVTALDTVRVRAARQGVFGAVGTSRDLRPLPNATVRIVGLGSAPVPLDSTGHFYVPIRSIGTYVLRATAPGYLAQTISLLVTPNEGVEIAFLLDSAVSGGSRPLEPLYAVFDSRAAQRGILSAIVPRSELLNGPRDLLRALQFARSFTSRNMRFGPSVCVFVDGVPRQGLPISAIEPAEVEAVELYGGNDRSGDRTRSLSRRWPNRGQCSSTGMPQVIAPGDDVVLWAVIWLKH